MCGVINTVGLLVTLTQKLCRKEIICLVEAVLVH
jgi:hypothetical protein